MSRLLSLCDDSLRNLLSWLDLRSICHLDNAIGNVDERLLWLHSLQMMDTQAVDKHQHCHLSIRWLIRSGARTTVIRLSRLNQKDSITDETFAGIGIHFVPTVFLNKKSASILVRIAFRRVCCFKLRSCKIANGADTGRSEEHTSELQSR